MLGSLVDGPDLNSAVKVLRAYAQRLKARPDLSEPAVKAMLEMVEDQIRWRESHGDRSGSD